jgi:twinkle protein
MAEWAEMHLPCEDCGSSDALSINTDGWSTCFNCHTRKKIDGEYTPKETAKVSSPLDKHVIDMMTHKQYRTITDRNISRETCEKYRCFKDGDNIIFGYSDKDGALCATKTRYPDKNFNVQGNWKAAGLYGQHLFSTSGAKGVTIVEGEFDALAAYQMLGSKWPVVSIKSGASGALKDCKAEYEWLNSFEYIVLCFDSDEAGKKAANQVSELFGAKAKIMKHAHGLKDACDYQRQHRGKEFSDLWWGAEQYVPDGIVQGSTLLDEVMAPIPPSDCDYPWAELNKLTYGIRKGELVTVTAGSGLGKSQVLREVVWHILNKSTDNIGLMFLEEGVRKTSLSIMSLAAGKPLHLPDSEATDEEKIDAFNATLGTGRLYLFDHFGSTSVDNIINRVRYLAKGLGCGYIFLDHISIVVSAQASGDERKAIDEIMTRLRMLVQETGVALIVVSHLKRPEGKGHEEGASTSLAQLRGSGAIAQLSDMVLGLERNGQAEDPEERNTTYVRVLKNRFSGITGPAGKLLYNHFTGRMHERRDEDEL